MSGAAEMSPPVVLRDAEQSSKLEAIAATGACEQGGLVALDFHAIRTAMAARWSLRKEDVQQRIEREISRHVARGTIFTPIGECEYLICFAEERGALAHVTAFQIMEDLLTHFLGKCSPDDLLVKRVTSVTAGEIEMATLDRAEVDNARRREVEEQPAAPAKPRLAAVLIESPTERLSVKLTPQKIVHVVSGTPIGRRLAVSLQRVGSDRVLAGSEETQLSTNCLIETTLLAIDTLQFTMATSKQPGAYTLPVYLPGMVSSRGRNAILGALRRFSGFDQRRLLIEVVGVERGTPTSRVMEAATHLKPFCRAVIGRGSFSRAGLASLGAARLSGVSLSARELGSSDAQVAAGLLAAGQAARKLAPMLLAADLPRPDLLNICAVAGFSHATLNDDDLGQGTARGQARVGPPF